jgi:hypothetical protein
MTGFDNTRGEIDVVDVMISSRVSQEYAREVIVVEFFCAVASGFNTNT